MSVEVRIPRLAESISEAVLAEWLKEDGAAVRTDEPIATLETDKAAVEIAAEQAGVLRHSKPAGATVTVGETIATIDPVGSAAAPSRAAAVAAPVDERPKTPAPPSGGTASAQPGLAAAAPALSPAVRRMVEQHGLDPDTIEPSGKGGRIVKEDVLRHLGTDAEREAAAAPSPPAPPAAPEAGATTVPAAAAPAEPRAEPPPRAARTAAPAPAGPDAVMTASGLLTWESGETERAVAMSRIRQRIAERLVEAQRTAAILTTFNEIDMSAVLALRARHKDGFEQRHGVKLGFMSFFARASILALQEVPELNAEVRGREIVYRRHVHLGVAVGTDRGLVVPVVRQADRLDFAGIEREIARLAAAARDARIALDDLSGGTFTISNGGVYGSLLSTPILNPPQSGILGMHKIEKRPVVGPADAIVVRPMMYVALSYDHRLVDGEQAVTFLVRVKERLEDPERMLLDV
jgi:2-oxoglutarate dehydrogenase E2 component (dihydrolipoamide succinyltransferase)